MENYTLCEEIGQGKYSIVYKGRKKKTIEYLAVKSVKKEARNQVLNEVEFIHELKHENVVEFYTWYQTPNHYWLLEEYCTGGNLLNIIKQDGKMPTCSVCFMLKSLFRGLRYIHSSGILHCNIKPSNILFDERGTLKYCDFGFAQRIPDLSSNKEESSQRGFKKGTPTYMAPELFDEKGIHSFASDMWSLGCMVFEMSSGFPPFFNSSFAELAKSILTEEFPIKKAGNLTNDEELLQITQRLLDKNAESRLNWGDLVSRDGENEHKFLLPLGDCQDPLPAQPAFEKYIGSKPSVSTSSTTTKPFVIGFQLSYDNPSQTPSAPSMAKQQGLVLMKEVKKMTRQASDYIKTETTKEYPTSHVSDFGSPSVSVHHDVVLAGTDAELNFGDSSSVTSSHSNSPLVAASPLLTSSKHTGSVAHQILQQRNVAFQEANRDSTKDEVKIMSPESPSHFPRSVPLPKQTSPSKEDPTSPELNKDENVQEEYGTISNPSLTFLPRPDSRKPSPLTPKIASKHSSRLESVNRKRRVQSAPSTRPDKSPGGEPERVISKKQRPISVRIPQHLTNPHSAGSGATPYSNLGDIAKLLFIQADKVVSPISDQKTRDYRGIKLPPNPPFSPISLNDMMALSRQDQEKFLTAVYSSIGCKSTVSSKLSYLEYFETLCVDTRSSNILINSNILGLFVEILTNTKSLSLKSKLCRVIGLMVRNATYISDQIDNLNLASLLTSFLSDKDNNLKRSAVSCLGELLFYMTTRDTGSDKTQWTLPPNSVLNMVKCLKIGDEATKKGVIQTIINISTASSSFSKLFASQEVLFPLFELYNTTTKESLKVQVSSAFERVCRQEPRLLFQLIDKTDIKVITENLNYDNSKIQQNFLNLLNTMLYEGPVRLRVTLVKSKSLRKTMRGLIEHVDSRVRAKSFLWLALSLRCFESNDNLFLFLNLAKMKVLPLFERISKEKENYVRRSMKVAIKSVVSLVPHVTCSLAEELRELNRQRSKLRVEAVQFKVQFFPIVLHLMTSPPLRSRIFDQQLVENLALFLREVEDLTFLPQGADDFKTTLLLIIEAVSQNSEILATHCAAVVTYLASPLTGLLRSQSGDTRCLCLRIFIDFLTEIFGYSTGSMSSKSLKELDDLLTQKLLPTFKDLLYDEEPIPPLGLKLLHLILDRTPGYVGVVEKLGLIPLFFKFFKLDHPNNNIHNLSLIKKIVESPDIPAELVYEHGIVTKVESVFSFAYRKNVDVFLDPILDIIHSLLFAARSRLQNGNRFIALNKPLVGTLTILIQLLNHRDPVISEKSSKCLSLIAESYPSSHKILLSPDNLPFLKAAIDSGNPSSHKPLLTAIYCATSSKQNTPKIGSLKNSITPFTDLNSFGKKISNLAKEILKSAK